MIDLNPSRKMTARPRPGCLFTLFLLAGFLVTCGPAQTLTVLKNFNANRYNPNGPLVQGPDNALYGTASVGGTNDFGLVFKVQPDGTGFTVLRRFSGSDGAAPAGGLILSGGTLYGTTYAGGIGIGNGTVFAMNTDGTGFTNLHCFTYIDGAGPSGVLMLSGTTLYGTTIEGGSFTDGTVFAMNTDGTGFTNLHNFSYSDGADPCGGLVLSGNTLYGTTQNSSPGYGTVFAINTDGSGFSTLHTFTGGSDGGNLLGGLVLSGSTLYGATQDGTVFAINTDASGFSIVYTFSGNPNGTLVLSGGTLYGTEVGGGSFGDGSVFAVNTNGTGFTTLYSFTAFSASGNSDGAYPKGGLFLSGNSLYGIATEGGLGNNGTVFKINTSGSGFATLYSFPGNNCGDGPYAGLLLVGNTLYGTTIGGGSLDFGTVFKVNTDGSGYTNLYNFSGNDGGMPHSGLVLSGSFLYGTTWYGGGSPYGTVFRINTNGQSFTTLYSFTGGADGGNPDGTLILSNGWLYGTTTGLNDPSGYGTVFKINLSGSAGAVLKYFAGGDGANPHGGLVLAGNTLYGTTASGTPGLGTVYAVNTDGSGFTNLYSFTGGNDGAFPNAGLVLSGSELFGTTMGFTSCKDWNCYTSYGTVFKINTNGSGFTVLYNFGLGAGSAGLQPSGALVLSGGMLYGDFFNTVFKVNTNGSGFTVLYGFSSYGSDGANPYGDLLLSGGTLYGTTYSGGINGEGTVFALNLSIPLNAAVAGGQMVLSWSDPTFSLQAAPIVTGPYQTVDGATSPYANAMTNSQMFFRLQQ